MLGVEDVKLPDTSRAPLVVLDRRCSRATLGKAQEVTWYQGSKHAY